MVPTFLANTETKSEIRISTSETNSQTNKMSNRQNPNRQNRRKFVFEFCIFQPFEFVSDFGFRYSDFPFCVSPKLGALASLREICSYRPFAFLSCASCSRKDKSNSSLTFNFIADRFLSLAITFSIALAVTMGRPGVTWL